MPAARGGGVASAERAEQLSGAPDPSRMEELVAPGAGSPPANGNGNGGGKGKQASPKGREVFRSQRRESEVRSPGSFCWGREVPAGGKRRLRGCGPVPLPHPEPPPPAPREPAGVPLSGLWARTPLLPSRWGLSSPLASAPGDVARSRASRYFPDTVYLTRSCSRWRWEFVPPVDRGANGLGAVEDCVRGGRPGRCPPPRLPSLLASPSHAPVCVAAPPTSGPLPGRVNETGFRRGQSRSEWMELAQDSNPHRGV